MPLKYSGLSRGLSDMSSDPTRRTADGASKSLALKHVINIQNLIQDKYNHLKRNANFTSRLQINKIKVTRTINVTTIMQINFYSFLKLFMTVSLVVDILDLSTF